MVGNATITWFPESCFGNVMFHGKVRMAFREKAQPLPLNNYYCLYSMYIHFLAFFPYFARKYIL